MQSIHMRLIFFIALTLACFSSCKKAKEKTQVSSANITESVYASGIVKSKNQYQVFSTVNGLIAKLLVTEGDTVKKGDPIIIISNEIQQLNNENAQLAAQFAAANINSDKLNELNENIELAKIKMNNDQSLLQRQRNLWIQGIGSKNELDQRELSYNNSTTAYQAAQMRYNDLKKQLQFSSAQSQKSLQISSSIAKDYTLKSNNSGRVYSLLKKQGELVNTQGPVAVIGDAHAFMLELQVDEYDIAKIRLGQHIAISLDSYKGQAFDAVVTKINPLMNDRTRSFTIEADFVTEPASLFPNLSVEANIIIQTKEKALLIPRNFLVNDTTVILENNEKRKITTGLKDYQRVEVLSGLNNGDIILKPVK